MAKRRKSLKKPRTAAFQEQGGHCYYCKHPMWLTNSSSFATKYKLTDRQARLFQCTGEHLKPHNEGGTGSQKNIVAACWFCNSTRHRMNPALTPKKYKSHVQKKIMAGQWNQHHF